MTTPSVGARGRVLADLKTRQTTRRRQTDRDERGPRLPEREPKATAS
jgi:hypothetical protein